MVAEHLTKNLEAIRKKKSLLKVGKRGRSCTKTLEHQDKKANRTGHKARQTTRKYHSGGDGLGTLGQRLSHTWPCFSATLKPSQHQPQTPSSLHWPLLPIVPTYQVGKDKICLYINSLRIGNPEGGKHREDLFSITSSWAPKAPLICSD